MPLRRSSKVNTRASIRTAESGAASKVGICKTRRSKAGWDIGEEAAT